MTLFVLKSAAHDIYRRLIDAVDPDVVEQAEGVLRRPPGVREVDSLRMRWIGHRLRGEAEITVDPDLTISQEHAIAEAAERSLIGSVRTLESITVQVAPPVGSAQPITGALPDRG